MAGGLFSCRQRRDGEQTRSGGGGRWPFPGEGPQRGDAGLRLATGAVGAGVASLRSGPPPVPDSPPRCTERAPGRGPQKGVVGGAEAAWACSGEACAGRDWRAIWPPAGRALPRAPSSSHSAWPRFRTPHRDRLGGRNEDQVWASACWNKKRENVVGHLCFTFLGDKLLLKRE